MINREHTVPITTQCKILNLSRSGVYYIPVLVRDKDRELMGLIDNIHLDEPYLGTRGIRDALLERGRKIGRSHVRTLMRKMGIEALYQKPQAFEASPRTYDLPVPSQGNRDYGSQEGVGHRYHVHPLAKGLCYLVAVMDLAGGKVLSRRVSNT